MIRHLMEKLRSLEKEIADERGDFSLFALFLREDAENRWDLVLSALWLNADSLEDINYIANKLKYRLGENELLFISRIVLLNLSDPIVKIINNNWGISRGGSLELNDPQIFNTGLPFKHAYIIISRSEKPVSVNVGKRRLRQSI